MSQSMTNVTGTDQRDVRDAAKRAWARRPRLALSALLGAMLLANVDVAVANVAGPSIRAGLHASGGELELVVSGYTLAYAVFLVTCARLGQAYGYRPMFLAGTGGFTVASLACALAPDAPFLVGARIAAGGTAALMAAQVLTGIQLGFAGRARARALGLYALVLSVGAVAGQSLGGLLISADLLLGAGGLGLGTGFTGMLGHLTSSVGAEHAADISGLFNTATRSGGVIGTAACGTLYFALADGSTPLTARATHDFALVNVALACTALASAAMAAASVRRR